MNLGMLLNLGNILSVNSNYLRKKYYLVLTHDKDINNFIISDLDTTAI